MPRGNKSMSGFGLQAVFLSMQRNINILRDKTLQSDEATEESLKDLEELDMKL